MAEVLIEKGIVITMNRQLEMIKNGAVAIDGRKITDVGRIEDIQRKHRAEIVIDASGKVVLPGFVNAHTHLHQTLLRGLGQDLPLTQWLEKMILPSAKAMTENDFYLSALLGYIENVKSGCTTVLNHHYVHTSKRNTDLVARAAKETGVRTRIARGCCDQGWLETFIEPRETILKECERLIRGWHGKAEGRIQIWPGPLVLWGCSPELWLVSRELAEKYQLGIHAHMNEVRSDFEFSEEKYGKRPFEVLGDMGLLVPNLQAAHCVWVSDRELELIKKNDVKVVHNPVANMYLASGVAPIPRMISQGITVALGTDGPASNNNQDMLTAMKFAACLHKVHNLDAGSITAEQVLKMATIDGAKALMMEKEIGSLEPGKKADIIIVDLQKAHIMPVHDPIGALVYCANINDVDTVLVDGKIVMEDKIIKTADEAWIKEKAQEAAGRIAEKLDR